MSEHHDVMCQVRESFSGLRMDTPVEQVFTRSRARRRRRLSGVSAAAAATAGAVAAVTLALGGPAPAGSSSGVVGSGVVSSGPVRLAAFSVTSGPGDSTTLILHKGPQYPRLDPRALRQALARHGIPALVTVGTFCRAGHGAAGGAPKVVRVSGQADGSDAVVIDGRAFPPGTRLSIGLFPGYARMLLIKDGAPLTCSSTSDQPAARITPTGTPIR